MTQAPKTPGSGAAPSPTPSQGDLTSVLRSRGYHVLLLAAALIGVPIAFIAFGFLAAVTAMEKWVWHSLPTNFGWDEPKPWYAVVVLVLAGALVGLIVTKLPGRGGHIPVRGMGAGVTAPIDLTGVLLAATLSLVLGAVVGPEAPLIALGGGLALLAANRTKLRESPQGATLMQSPARLRRSRPSSATRWWPPC